MSIKKNMFQFHYGTIKRKDTNAVPLLAYCFNSTMVRLKVVHLCDLPICSVFQFHYGTIKSIA